MVKNVFQNGSNADVLAFPGCLIGAFPGQRSNLKTHDLECDSAKVYVYIVVCIQQLYTSKKQKIVN